MRKLALCLMLVACLGFLAAPVYALPACPHSNSQGVTSVNLGNCILNGLTKVVAIITVGLVTAKKYVCGAGPDVLAVVSMILPIAIGDVAAQKIVNICNSLLKTGCSDQVSLDDLVAYINSYNASHATQLTRATATFIDPTPIINWGGLK